MGYSQVGKAPGFDPGIRRFESCYPIHFSKDNSITQESPFILNESEKKDFASSILKETYCLNTLNLNDEIRPLSSIVTDLNEQLSLNSLETLNARHTHFKIPKTIPQDYSERLFELDSKNIFLAGIRHVGGNPKLPFVNITAGVEMTDLKLSKIISIINNEFKIFKPKQCALWLKPNSESKLLNFKLKPANNIWAAKIKNLNLSLKGITNFTIKPISTEDYFSWYENEYQNFHSLNPSLKNWVTINEESTLEDYKNQGLLYGAYLNDKLAGLIGGENSPLLGLPALYIGELLISEELRGKGLAVEMQRQFLNLNKNEFDYVWGTIDARNISSSKTALKVGRKKIRTEYFTCI